MRNIACTLSLLVALPACTLITDFSKPGDDLYSLDENMNSQIAVSLSGDTASLTLSFVEPLPGAAEDDQALLGLISGGTIGLTVANDVTGVNFNLANDGTYSETLSGPGQYNLALGTDRGQISINLYNQVQGASLYAGGDYSATIAVLDNDWFESEEFVRDVTVQ
jgi:hypothetical protein